MDQQGQPPGGQNGGLGVANHLIGLMANPVLAAAAAASPVFPPAAMLTNPGAYFALPDIYQRSAGGTYQTQHSVNGSTSNIGNMVMPQMATSMPSNCGSNHQIMSNNIINSTNNGYSNGANQHTIPHQQQHQQIAMNMGGQQIQMHYVGLPMHTMQQPQQPNSSSNYLQMGSGSNNNNTATADVAESHGPAHHIESVGPGYELDENGKRRKELSPAQRAKQNRDRNREHARSTRLRKKAYVQKLKELVEGLHAERTEEVRQRRVAIQHLADMQNVRRAVIRSFLRYHSANETDKRKWCTILEDSFWLKQPVTPYRCFRRGEIKNECRISRGVDAVVADAASIAVMVEGVGSRSTRWMQMKREEFFVKEEERSGVKRMPRNIVGQNSRFQHAVSSLSSSSNSSSKDQSGSSGEEATSKKNSKNNNQKPSCNNNTGNESPTQAEEPGGNGGSKNGSVKDGVTGSQDISNSSGSSSNGRSNNQRPSDGFHDYHAQPLPDPKLADSERSSASASEDSPEDSQNGSGDGKRISTDSSSGDDSAEAINQQRPAKRRKHEHDTEETKSEACSTTSAPSVHSNSSLPQNIAKKGGIQHAVRPVVFGQTNVHNTNARLAAAPAVVLPPFAGIGKRTQILPSATVSLTATKQASPLPPPVPSQASPVPSGVSGSGAQNTTGEGGSGGAGGSSMLDGGAAVISGDVETSSSNSSRTRPQIEAYYHMNEDDMILMEDILMCPFVFRTQGAVQCGALAECVMPGMLRGHFSNRNKLLSMEMVYDAMGFMQQLERASGSEPTAQIIPGSLEMALTPSDTEARVIALAEPPFLIVNVSEAWTRMTKFTQMEAEGKELFKLLQGPGTEGQPDVSGHNLDDVSNGQCTCSSRLHYDKDGREFVHFISSFPLTNTSNEITHILHVSKELPILDTPSCGTDESS